MPFAKTEFGIQAFKDRTPLMSARQRAAFVLINGVRDTRSLFSLTSSLGVNAEDLTHLVVQGFIVRALIPQGLAGGLPEVVDSQFQSVEPAERLPGPHGFSAQPGRGGRSRLPGPARTLTQDASGLGPCAL